MSSSSSLPPVIHIPNNTIRGVMDFSVLKHMHVYYSYISGSFAMIQYPAHLYSGTVSQIHDQFREALEGNPGTTKVVIIGLATDGKDPTTLKEKWFNANRHIDRVVCKALQKETGEDICKRDVLRLYVDEGAVQHILAYCFRGEINEDFTVPTETYEVDLSFLVEQDVLQYDRKKQQQYSIACVREAFNTETAELMKYSTKKVQKFIKHYVVNAGERQLNEKELSFIKGIRLISSCVTKPHGDNITVAYGEYSRTLNKQFAHTKQLVMEIKKEIDETLYPNWISTLDGTASTSLAGYAETVEAYLTK